MKVLLVVPTYKYTQGGDFLSVTDFPVGLAYIASALKKAGHEVVGLNPNNIQGFTSPFDMLANKLHQAITEHEPDLIGLGGLCNQYTFIKDAITIIRNQSKIPIVLGGNIISKDKEFIFENLKPDYGIIGEGEEAIVKLCEMLEGVIRVDLAESVRYVHTLDVSTSNYYGTGANPSAEIDNLCYWVGDEAKYTPVNYGYGNLDDRAFPDYEVFGVDDMVDNYSMATRILYRYSRAYPRPMTIITARSCPFACTFCRYHDIPYRARSVENIMEEIKELYEKYEFNILIIGDELFAVNKKRMVEFCEALIEAKEKYGWDFDWMFQTHPSAKLDKETLGLAKESGCYFFSYGIESASSKVLESMNKKSNVGGLEKAVALARETGIGFGGNLIFGDPAESPETVYESLDFFQKYGWDNQIFTSLLQPYPGNALFDSCVERGMIPDKEDYYENIGGQVFNMTHLSNDQWIPYINFFGILEGLWLNVPSTTGMVEEDEEENPISKFHRITMHKVSATCPHCGAGSTYREMWDEAPMYLGTGCQSCNRRVKVYLNGYGGL